MASNQVVTAVNDLKQQVKEPTAADVRSLNILDYCLMESMRLRAKKHGTLRVALEDIPLDDIIIPKGSFVKVGKYIVATEYIDMPYTIRQ